MKKALAVIISLSIALGVFSSCSQKDNSGESEVSVAYVSIPDEPDSDSLSSQSGSDESGGYEHETDKSEAESSNTDSQYNQSEVDKDAPEESDSQSQSAVSSPSSDSSSSQNSGNSQSSVESQPSQPVVTTAPSSSGGVQTVKTTTTTQKSAQAPNAITTTATAKPAQTQTTTALKPTVTTHATAVTLASADTKYPDGATVINLSSPGSCNDPNVSASANKICINAGGTYYLSGSFNGQVYIKTGEGKSGETNVDLYLAGVDITCTYGPAIFCDNAKRFKIHLVENTANVVQDGGSDATNNGAISSNDTIEIKGKGTLTVYGNNREGIASDDDIFIENGNIYIFSADDGVNANDCITVNGGYTYIEAGGDGIDSKGTTVMSGGTVIIAKTGENESAIESDSTYTLNGGTLIAIGGTGEVKGASNKSTQGIITLKMNSILASQVPICVKNGESTLVTFMPVSSYSALTFTCPELKKGTAYDVYIRGSVTGGTYSFGVITNAVVSGAQLLASVTAQ